MRISGGCAGGGGEWGPRVAGLCGGGSLGERWGFGIRKWGIIFGILLGVCWILVIVVILGIGLVIFCRCLALCWCFISF